MQPGWLTGKNYDNFATTDGLLLEDQTFTKNDKKGVAEFLF